MRMRYFLLLIVVTPCASLAQGVTLADLLQTVREGHPLFGRESRAVEIEATSRERALAAQDWNLISRAFYAYQEPPGEDLFSPSSVHGSGINVNLDKVFYNTGGRLSVKVSHSYIDQDLPFLDFGADPFRAGLPYYYQTEAYLTYSQPLWQNRGGTLDRLEYELADFSVELARLRAAENQEGFLLEVGLRYLDWAAYLEQSAIVKARHDLAQEQLSQVRRRRELNLVDEVDVLRAVNAVHSGEEALVRIEARYRAMQAELAEIAQWQDLYDRAPAHDLYGLSNVPESDDAVAQLRQRSRLLRSFAVAGRQLKRRLAAATGLYDPDLSLDVGYGLRQQDEGFADALGVSEPDAFVALSLSLPLGRRQAKSDIESLQLGILQVEDLAREAGIQLESTLRSLRIEVERIEEVLRLDERQIESARQRAQEELRLYNQGRGQLAFVISARDDVARAQLNRSQNALVYQKLLLRYRELMDELI